MTPEPRRPDYPAAGSLGVWMMALALTFASAGTGFSLGPMISAVSADMGWSKPQVALGTSLCMITAMLASTPLGRMVDRGRGVEAIALMLAWGGLMLLAVSQAQSLWQWYLAWGLAGPGFAGAMYEPAFAFFARRLGPNARGAMIRMTLVAGFTSTFAFLFGGAFIPLTGWRGAYLGFAMLSLLAAVPLAWFGGQSLRRGEARPKPGQRPESGAVAAALATGRFWILGAVLGLMALNHNMLLTMALPLFTSLGTSLGLATIFAASLGPFQVLGRFGLMIGAREINARIWTVVMISMMLGGLACLVASQAQLWLIMAYVALQGTSIGIVSILRPMLTADVMGMRGFGAVSGTLAIASLIAAASAPVLAAAIFQFGGTMALLTTCFATVILALILCLCLPRRPLEHSA